MNTLNVVGGICVNLVLSLLLNEYEIALKILNFTISFVYLFHYKFIILCNATGFYIIRCFVSIYENIMYTVNVQ